MKTEKGYDEKDIGSYIDYLNHLYGDRRWEEVEQELDYLSVRSRENPISRAGIMRAYTQGNIGMVIRNHDSIAFYAGLAEFLQSGTP